MFRKKSKKRREEREQKKSTSAVGRCALGCTLSDVRLIERRSSEALSTVPFVFFMCLLSLLVYLSGFLSYSAAIVHTPRYFFPSNAAKTLYPIFLISCSCFSSHPHCAPQSRFVSTIFLSLYALPVLFCSPVFAPSLEIRSSFCLSPSCGPFLLIRTRQFCFSFP